MTITLHFNAIHCNFRSNFLIVTSANQGTMRHKHAIEMGDHRICPGCGGQTRLKGTIQSGRESVSFFIACAAEKSSLGKN